MQDFPNTQNGFRAGQRCLLFASRYSLAKDNLDKSAMRNFAPLQHMSVGTAVCIRYTAASAPACRPDFSSGGAAPATAIPQTTAFDWQRPGRHQHHQLCRSSDRDADLEESLRNDMERLQRKQGSDKKSRGQSDLRQTDIESTAGFAGGLKQTIDKVLIADFFFICIALAWLAAGVAEKGSLNSTKLLDSWYPLWTLLFQPALGVLMLGALVSGAAGWLRNKSSA